MQHSHKFKDLRPWHAASGGHMSLRLRFSDGMGPASVLLIPQLTLFERNWGLMFWQGLEFNYADWVLEGHNWQCLLPDKSQSRTNWTPMMDHSEGFNPETPPQSV